MTFPTLTARLGVYTALIVTLWFNGSYAWGKAVEIPERIGLVALALAVDLCKSGFLAAASHCWHHQARLAATALVVLWFPAIAYSTFCGYASLTTNRAQAVATDQHSADARTRITDAKKRLTADLTTAQSSPLWTASAACTAPKKPQQAFCENVGNITTRLAELDARLNDQGVRDPNPELSVLVAVTGLALPALTLIVTAWPAILAELVASIGFYALHRAPRPEAPRSAPESFLDKVTTDPAPRHQNATTSDPRGSNVASVTPSKPKPPPTRIVWQE
ncbi:MAG: hypothetical protein ABL901_00905 [Hyphomicrobiaceae bacterium]